MDSRVCETESALGLVGGDALRDLDNVLIESTAHKLEITKDERLLHIEANRDNVGGILPRVLLDVGYGECGAEQELLVVRKHDDEGDIKHILQPLGEGERDHVTKVHAVAAGAAPGVEEEGFAGLVAVQDTLEVAVGEEHAPTEQDVWAVSGDGLETLQQLG